MNKRTSFITAGAVTGVLLAGTAAIGANIGILNAADNGNVGELSAAVAVNTAPATAVESLSQQFAVVGAGSVTVSADSAADSPNVFLDGVDVADGWTWTSSQAAGGELVVTFTSDAGEYVFSADLAADGTISARVDEPLINIVRVPAAPTLDNSASATTSYDDDGSDDDGSDDDDHDDDHEGGDDDD